MAPSSFSVLSGPEGWQPSADGILFPAVAPIAPPRSERVVSTRWPHTLFNSLDHTGKAAVDVANVNFPRKYLTNGVMSRGFTGGDALPPAMEELVKPPVGPEADALNKAAEIEEPASKLSANAAVEDSAGAHEASGLGDFFGTPIAKALLIGAGAICAAGCGCAACISASMKARTKQESPDADPHDDGQSIEWEDEEGEEETRTYDETIEP
mmetsp:Transcript_128506/g.256711  ORF Transcript_128506/g.256711 Transcript_128506/m.256711 type:complete len:211 (-) Transcript_128506:77-709(-)|eukprot:CAMPEP_0172713936 /NCGR_PEP_ID=MMETSP1074-20121228/64168_1 /TAXON_ID=2916 /ORGANISM="Ceratium fusus, Strain PA161109" /LENGTH=210 /DNA_ID=CAMNT_0013538185 /DNA_START=36 /DNA_END=668 /DNA_ORIENTATION=+